MRKGPAIRLAALALLVAAAPPGFAEGSGRDLEDAVNAAILVRESGGPGEDAGLWAKAAGISPANPFIWTQLGWSRLSSGMRREAEEAFRKAVEASSGSVSAAEADFGLGMSLELDSDYKSAKAAYEDACVKSPYLFPAASLRLGLLEARTKRWPQAELYLSQSLERDPLQPEAVSELARARKKLGSPDRADEAPLRRLAKPLLRVPSPPPGSPLLRVGLYSDGKGAPSPLLRIGFASGVDAAVEDARGSKLARAGAYDLWRISFDAPTRTIEVRDAAGQVKLALKRPFRIVPEDRGSSVLLKDAEAAAARATDMGDRELRGAVDVFPEFDGFVLVNELGEEEYLYGIVSTLLPPGSPEQALKAAAIAARSRAEAARRRARRAGIRMDVCDSTPCQAYAGLTDEREDATQAVIGTAGALLYKDGGVVDAGYHLDCGGLTEEGVQDRENPPPDARSPWSLDSLTHGRPQDDLYCSKSPLAGASWTRWARVVDADDLRDRLGSKKGVGAILSVRVVKRTAAGRARVLEVAGDRGKTVIKGEEEIEDFLLPGGMRSGLFTLQPLYRGGTLRTLVIWGAGTGGGHGLCLAGTLGLAQEGRSLWTILMHYFPGSEIRGLLSQGPVP